MWAWLWARWFLAISEALSVLWIMPAMQDFVSFALLVIVLIVMPGGMMGLVEQIQKELTLARGNHVSQRGASFLEDMGRPGRSLSFCCWIPVFGNRGGYLQTLCFLTFLYVTLSTAWNILGGYAGQTSFGHATFYGLGAYTTAILVLRGVPPLLTMPLAGLIAALYGAHVGLSLPAAPRPVFRHRHHRGG